MAQMVLHIYDEENELVKTVSQNFVPWRMLKQAIKVQKAIGKKDASEYTEEDVDQIGGLVLSVFGNRLTKEDIDRADLTEMLAVVEQINQAANGGSPRDPTQRG